MHFLCNSRKNINLKVLKIKSIHTTSMYKNTTNNPIEQHKKLFSLAEPVFGKKIMVDYKAQRSKYEQRVIAKTEVGAKGSKIRFVVTKNKNNSPEPHLLYMPEHGMRLCMPIGQFRV